MMKNYSLQKLLPSLATLSRAAHLSAGWLLLSIGWSEGIAQTFQRAKTVPAIAQAANNGQTYADIEGHWAQSCIQRLNQQGIVEGYADNTFRPNSSITRSEYAALINQAFPTVTATREAVRFIDVPADYWGQEAIQTAYRRNFLSGYSNQVFRPSALISRAEAYVALDSGLEYAQPDSSPQAILAAAYTDGDSIPDYAAGAIAAATQQGIVVNDTLGANAFRPFAPATRAQVAATLCEIKYADTSLPDGYTVNPVESPENSQPENDVSITLSQTCENETSGFTVNYPGGWLTNSSEVTELCYAFDPESITLPEQSSSLNEAIHIRVDSVPFERAAAPENPTETELSRRMTTVDGREAIVVESESNGLGLIPEGVNTYTYLVNLNSDSTNSDSTLIATTYDFAGQPYARNKQILDQMINTLTIR